MKKFSVLLTLAVLMVSSSVFAGSIDYLSNQSAKYVMNAARTASTDGADIVAYNPAGTALMGEGFFIDVSNQTLLKYYSQDVTYTGAPNNIAKDTYEQSTPTILLPNVYLAYNAGTVGIGNLAVYGQAGVPAGGGSLSWDGVAGLVATAAGFGAAATSQVTSINCDAEGSSVYYAFGGGVAYSFLENMFSVSAGAKYVMARRSTKIEGNIGYLHGGLGAWTLAIDTEYDYDAEGYTPVFGFDVKPMKELTIGVRYEMETDLEFEYDQKTNSVTPSNLAFAALATGGTNMLNKDGLKDNLNLPQILSIGAEYVVTPEMTVGITANMFFLGNAKMEITSRSSTGVASTVDYSEYFGTGYEVAVAASYKVMEQLKIGATFMYTDQGAKDKLLKDQAVVNTTSSNPVLNSTWIGLGAIYTVIPNLDITVAAGWVHYLPEKVDIATSASGTPIGTTKVEYSKEVYNIALGASYKI